MNGFFTPTEAGSVGTMAVLILSVAKKDINFKGYIKSLLESLRTACMVLMLIAGSTILGHFLAVTKIPILTADWVAELPLNRYVIMIIISLIYQVGGSFIDDLAFMILATPIFYPCAIKLGFDPLWFAMLIGLTIMIGVVIPPVASNVFVVKNITKVPLGVIYSGVYPFLISLVVVTILLFIFPGMATLLPNLLHEMRRSDLWLSLVCDFTSNYCIFNAQVTWSILGVVPYPFLGNFKRIEIEDYEISELAHFDGAGFVIPEETASRMYGVSLDCLICGNALPRLSHAIQTGVNAYAWVHTGSIRKV